MLSGLRAAAPAGLPPNDQRVSNICPGTFEREAEGEIVVFEQPKPLIETADPLQDLSPNHDGLIK
jgi:hypothetical protein